MPDPSPLQHHTLTPTTLNAEVRAALERGFPLFWIEGEVSNFLKAKSGHLYFSLKDAGAQVRCAMWRPRAMLLRFVPTDGQQVLARARMTLYEPRGEFQLQIEHLEPAGQGALQRAFDELKTRLALEGLFDSGRKRALPVFPQRIAIVSSASGAAIRDIVSVLARRFPLLEADLFPSLVQGAEAPAQLRVQLDRIAALRRHDLVLVTRGGGSIEDLFAFNDEALARRIASMPMPVVSAVGHEVDFTIADFVADLRAPTPSAAAELIAPSADALRDRLAALERRLGRSLSHRLDRDGQRADRLQLRLQARHPLTRFNALGDRLRASHARLIRLPAPLITQRRQRLEQLHLRLQRAAALERIALLVRRADDARQRLQATCVRGIQHQATHLAGLARSLNALSPLATLERGYAIVFDANGHVIQSIEQVESGDALRIRVRHGEFRARAEAKIQSG
ncbi:MAG: exodeoxyribonuclease VII large subunit [Rhodanobacteraceae bacterium]|nr:exodeoxyribonuclease VII large subunit [Rhodanobacteraceae bacterium]MBP9153411.1 exodeoxyribonuclease VII large subunit [Xanthomonadales bacterium]